MRTLLHILAPEFYFFSAFFHLTPLPRHFLRLGAHDAVARLWDFRDLWYDAPPGRIEEAHFWFRDHRFNDASISQTELAWREWSRSRLSTLGLNYGDVLMRVSIRHRRHTLGVERAQERVQVATGESPLEPNANCRAKAVEKMSKGDHPAGESAFLPDTAPVRGRPGPAGPPQSRDEDSVVGSAWESQRLARRADARSRGQLSGCGHQSFSSGSGGRRPSRAATFF